MTIGNNHAPLDGSQPPPIRPDETSQTQQPEVDFDSITRSEGFDDWLNTWVEGVQKENEQSRASVAGRVDRPHDMASELAKVIDELNPEDVIAAVPFEETQFCDELDDLMETFSPRQSTQSPVAQRESENVARNFDAYLTDSEEELDAMQSSSSETHETVEAMHIPPIDVPMTEEPSVQAPVTAPPPPAANPAKPVTIKNALQKYWSLVDDLNKVKNDSRASLDLKNQCDAIKENLIRALGPTIAKALESSKIQQFSSIDDDQLSQVPQIIGRLIQDFSKAKIDDTKRIENYTSLENKQKAYKSALEEIKTKLEESQGGDKKLRYKTTTGELQTKASRLGFRLGLLGKSRASKNTMAGILRTIKTILDDRQTPAELKTLAHDVLKTLKDHPWGAGVLSSRKELQALHAELTPPAAHPSSATLASVLDTFSEPALEGGVPAAEVRTASRSVESTYSETLDELDSLLSEESSIESSFEGAGEKQTVESFKALHQEELGPLQKRYQEISALIEEQKKASKLLKPFIQLKIGIKGVPFLYQCIKQRRLLNELESLYFKEQLQAAKKNESETGPSGPVPDTASSAEGTESTTDTLPGVWTRVSLDTLAGSLSPLLQTSPQTSTNDFDSFRDEVSLSGSFLVLDEVDPSHTDLDLGFLADLLAEETPPSAAPAAPEGEATRRNLAVGLWEQAEELALPRDQSATLESVHEQTTHLGKAIGNLEELQTEFPKFILDARLAVLTEKFQNESKVNLGELSPDELQRHSVVIRELSEQVRSVEKEFLEATESQRQAKIEHEKNQTESAKVFLKGLTTKIEGMTAKQKLVIAEQRGATSRDLLASQSEEVPLPKPEDLLAAFTTAERGKFGKTGTSTEARRTLAKLVEICEGYSELKGASKECETLFKALRNNEWFKEALSNNPDLQQKFLSVTAAVELPNILTLISSLNQPENVKMKLVLEDGTVVLTKRKKIGTTESVGTGQESVDVVMHMISLCEALKESKRSSSYIEKILEKLSETKAEDTNTWLHAVVSKHPEISAKVTAIKSDIAAIAAAKEANISDSQLVDNFKDPHFCHNFLLSYGFVINEVFDRKTDTRPDCVKLFAYLNKIFADEKTPFEVKANIMHMAKEWVTTPFINGGSANIALAQDEIGKLLDKAKESGSPTLSNLADSLNMEQEMNLAIDASATQKFVDGQNEASEVFELLGQGAEVDPAYVEDFARSLTACNTAAFSQLTASEFSRLAWSKGTASATSPNIVQLTNNFNAIKDFIVRQVVIRNRELNPVDDAAFFKYMASQLSFLMDVVDELLRPGTTDNPKTVDVHSAYAIMAAINDTSINRLRPLVDANIDQARLIKYEANSRITDTSRSYAAQRQFEASVAASDAFIPYIGTYLSDLTFSGEGNPSHSEGQVSTTIPALIGKSITYLQEAQNHLQQKVDEDAKRDPPVANMQSVFKMTTILSTRPSKDEAYDISLLLKPRGS